MEYTAVFQGGGMKGLAYAGALLALEENGFYPVRASGTSIGALFASLVMAGYTGYEIINILKEIDISKIFNSSKINIKEIISTKGLHSIKPLEDVVTYYCSKRGLNTFKDVIETGKIKLKMVATDTYNKREIVFPDNLYNYGFNPKLFPISAAVAMSATYPGYFKPMKLGGITVIDGGVINNFPYNVFDYRPEELIIGFVLQKSPVKNVSPHIRQLTIDTTGVKVLDFKMDKKKQLELIRKGYEAGLKFISKIISTYN